MNVLQAQTPWNKELKTESDGFQWYEYTYEKNSNGRYPKAAFDLNGNRLTCTTEHLIEYRHKTEDSPFGSFLVWTKTDAEGHHIYAYYDTQGDLVVPECYGATYYGGKYLCVNKKPNGRNKFIKALYDRQMNYIIPESYGFTSITPMVDYDLIICDGSMILQGKDLTEKSYFTFSIDGRYYVDFFCLDKAKFNPKKKPVSTLNVDSYASGSSSSNNSSSSSSTTTTTTVTPTLTPQTQPQQQPIHQPQPMQVWKPCPYCQGSGKCHVCLGDGHPLQNPTGRCITCNGTGKCSHCAGNGGQNVIEYH
jgi:hypothetical protein